MNTNISCPTIYMITSTWVDNLNIKIQTAKWSDWLKNEAWK